MHYPDVVDLETDDSDEGDEVATFGVKMAALRVRIQDVSGDETWRGRRIEGGLSHVVHSHLLPELGAIPPNSRFKVIEWSWADDADSIYLNIVHTRLVRMAGRARTVEYICRSRADGEPEDADREE